MTSFDRRLAPRGGPRPDRALERDACGIGFVADVTGRADRRVVELGLQGLARLRHRGAFAADEQTGDGAGVLMPIPRRLIGHALGVTVAEASRLGLLMLFISDRRSPGEVCAAVEDACGRERLRVVRWRDVPVDPSALGDHARDTRPRILQAVLSAPSADDAARSEQRAHRARRRIDAFARAADRDVYVASCSFVTVTYKALAAADRLAAFYPDLLDPDVEAPFVVFHQRYSTNTAPTWERAQPFRMLCHNGEINTIAGNANRMHARGGALGLATPAEEALFRPVIDDAGSDSAILDETVELIAKEGGGGGRAGHPSCDRHARSRCMGRRARHGRDTPRVLSVALVAHGTVGRPGGADLHGRCCGRGGARPERAAALALLGVRMTGSSSARRRRASSISLRAVCAAGSWDPVR